MMTPLILRAQRRKDTAGIKSYQIWHFTPFRIRFIRHRGQVKDKREKPQSVKGALVHFWRLTGNAGEAKVAIENRSDTNFRGPRISLPGTSEAERMALGSSQVCCRLFDPPREDAKATIATAKQMGVKVKMVTGDALAIAKETAKKLDMGTNILDAATLGDLEEGRYRAGC